MNPSEHNHTTRDPLGHAPSGDEYSDEYSEEWLSAYVDHELTDAQRTIVEQRVAHDSDAQRLLGELQQMRSLVGQLPPWTGAPLDHARLAEGIAQPDLGLHSESFAETLAEACQSHSEDPQASLDELSSRVNVAGGAARRDVRWWRPVALAVCLALLTGGGVWWWQADSSTTLATSARTTEPAAEATRDRAPPAPQLEAAPEALAFEARQVEDMQLKMAPEMASRSASEGLDETASESASEGFSEGIASRSGGGGAPRGTPGEVGGGGLDQAAEAGMAHARIAAADAVDVDAAEVDAAAVDAAEARIAAAQPSLGRGTASSSVAQDSAQPEQRQLRLDTSSRDAAVQLQMAHSAGWSMDEITAAMQRLTLVLNLPSSDSEDSVRAEIGPAADIPIALIAHRPVDEQATPLVDILSQQSVVLQQFAPSDVPYLSQPAAGERAAAAKRAATEVPAADIAASDSVAARPSGLKAAARAEPTVALFVLREEAEQILEAARQSGEILANPVWITSASGSTAPGGPAQQVVLLFTPQ